MPTALHFLVHDDGDHVAVAVADIKPGPVQGAVLATNGDVNAEVNHDVPLGHKFALTDLEQGAAVIEYGVQIGVTTAAIAKGDYVHTHNLRSARWERSTAQ
jgi:(2R)-sulfolactate sulfo-lyase subunit alpha